MAGLPASLGRPALALLAALVVTATWTTAPMAPLRLAVTAVHELGHAAAALLTGGEVLHIGISENEAGATLTRGGLRGLVLWAGYPAPVWLGAALLARRRAAHRREGGLGGVVADLLGLGLVIAGVGDLLSDLLAAPPDGDAAALAGLTGVPSLAWGLSWAGAGALALWGAWRRAMSGR